MNNVSVSFILVLESNINQLHSQQTPYSLLVFRVGVAVSTGFAKSQFWRNFKRQMTYVDYHIYIVLVNEGIYKGSDRAFRTLTRSKCRRLLDLSIIYPTGKQNDELDPIKSMQPVIKIRSFFRVLKVRQSVCNQERALLYRRKKIICDIHKV